MSKQKAVINRLKRIVTGAHWIHLPHYGDRYFESLNSEVRKVFKTEFYHN